MDSAERVHGGLRAAELAALGIAPEAVLDLSVNVNPYGPCDAVREAIARCRVDCYPEPDSARAREALGAALGVAGERVVLGNGASELLWTLARVLAPAPSPVVIAEPAFGEMRAAAEALGHAVVSVRGCAAAGHVPELERVALAVRRAQAAFVYLCSPSTPVGTALAARDVAALAEAAQGAYIVLDESFLSLSDGHADAQVPLPDNVLRVRSLTKDHALPGLRVGYALVPPHVARAVERARPSWTVSALAQAVAEVALRQAAFVAESRNRLAEDRRALVDGLRALGLAPLPSSAPYLTIPVASAARARERLLVRHGVLVRDCSSFGLPAAVRVAVRPAGERARLLAALAEERAAC